MYRKLRIVKINGNMRKWVRHFIAPWCINFAWKIRKMVLFVFWKC